MSLMIGNKISIDIFGESHAKAIGVVINGLPPGEEIDIEKLKNFMSRRRGGKNFTTPREESDTPIFLSGVLNNKTTGAPLCAIIENNNIRKDDYSSIAFCPRPSHADYPAYVKYKGFNDMSGGGHFSGRLTAPLCIAGNICMQILERDNIKIGAHIASIAGICDSKFDMCAPRFGTVSQKDFPVIDDRQGLLMLEEIENAKKLSDSVGGTVECAITGLPAGIGEPMFDSIESRISSAVFGIGAVRGIEFGAGFTAAKMRGSQHNDPYCIENGKIETRTNNHGGVIGGISSGMPIIFTVAFKPTPSIGIEQETVNFKTMQNAKIKIEGRHDPCIVPRAVPCVEAASAITVLDILLNSN